MELLDIALLAHSVSLELLKIKLPESVEQFDRWDETFENTLKQHLGHFSVFHNGKVVRPQAISASLHTMGYTEASFHEIAGKLETFIHQELTEAQKLQSEMERVYNEAEERINDATTTVVVNGGTYRAMTRTARMLDHAVTELGETIEMLSYDAWVEGVRPGLTMLGHLAKAYK